MDVQEAMEIHIGDKIWHYDIKRSPVVKCCKAVKRFEYATGYTDWTVLVIKPINSNEKEFVSKVKNLYWTEESAQEHLEKHIQDNINIYEREIERAKKEYEKKTKEWKQHLKKFKALIRKLEKQKGKQK
jgi:hypothetical protein